MAQTSLACYTLRDSHSGTIGRLCYDSSYFQMDLSHFEGAAMSLASGKPKDID